MVVAKRDAILPAGGKDGGQDSPSPEPPQSRGRSEIAPKKPGAKRGEGKEKMNRKARPTSLIRARKCPAAVRSAIKLWTSKPDHVHPELIN